MHFSPLLPVMGWLRDEDNWLVHAGLTSLIHRPFPLLIACSMQNGGRRPGISNHVICSIGVTCHHACMYCHAMEKTVLVLCTSYEDEINTNGGQHQSYKVYLSYTVEGIALNCCRTTCMKYLQWQNLANIAKRSRSWIGNSPKVSMRYLWNQFLSTFALYVPWLYILVDLTWQQS